VAARLGGSSAASLRLGDPRQAWRSSL